MNTESDKHSYDEVPYPSYSYPRTHPAHLATMGRFFGMKPKEMSNARVLELGCASGNNLIPVAYNYPKTKCVGVDLSSAQLAQARQMSDQLNLKNIRFIQKDILEVEKDLGEFDYIIAHGVFSWVPEEVQEKILEICQKHLHPQGIAYISYNTYPGWHMRGMLRDMMLYHTRNIQEPAQQISQAKALVNFLSKSVPTENNPYGILLQKELETMKTWPDNYFFHDSLEAVNQPLYFHEFNDMARSHGMKFLSESRLASMLAGNFPKETSDTLQKMCKSIVDMEQYIDFIRNRMFRETLICHQDVTLKREVHSDVIKSFYFSGVIQMNPDVQATEFAKAACQSLAEAWPNYLSFNQIFERVKNTQAFEGRDSEELENQLAQFLLTTFAKGLLNVSCEPIEMHEHSDDMPEISELVRTQAKFSNIVTNQYHCPVVLDNFRRYLISQLDGHHDKDGLIAELIKLQKEGKVQVESEEKKVDNEDDLRDLLNEQYLKSMDYFVKSALF